MTFGTLDEESIQKFCISCTPKMQFLEQTSFLELCAFPIMCVARGEQYILVRFAISDKKN